VSTPKEAGEKLADLALEKMRGGPLLAIGPARSRMILAALFEEVICIAVGDERDACAEIADRAAAAPTMSDARIIADKIRGRGRK